jgi:uncharacterized membrane protein
MVSNSFWYSRLAFLGSAIISAIREIIAKAINGGDIRRVSDRTKDYASDVVTILFISAVLVIGIMVVLAEVVFVVILFLLLLLEHSL